DPDNPTFAPPTRKGDGTLIQPEDGPAASVTYTQQGLPQGAQFDADTIQFVWTPGFNQAGDYAVTFTATDDGDGTGVPATVSVTVPIRVRNVNRAPAIASIDNLTLQRGQSTSIEIHATDADSNPITIRAESGLPFFPLPRFMTFVDHGNGTA